MQSSFSSIGQLTAPTMDDRFKVFCIVRSFPQSMADILEAAERHMSNLRVYRAVAQLELDGLIVAHCDSPLEWRLADVD